MVCLQASGLAKWEIPAFSRAAVCQWYGSLKSKGRGKSCFLNCWCFQVTDFPLKEWGSSPCDKHLSDVYPVANPAWVNRPKNGTHSRPHHLRCLLWCEHWHEGHLDLVIPCYCLKPWCTVHMYMYDPDTYWKKWQPEVFNGSCILVSGFLENPQFSP